MIEYSLADKRSVVLPERPVKLAESAGQHPSRKLAEFPDEFHSDHSYPYQSDAAALYRIWLSARYSGAGLLELAIHGTMNQP
jgi:hypothetical protein